MPPAMFISDADRQRKRDAQQKQRAFLEEQLADLNEAVQEAAADYAQE